MTVIAPQWQLERMGVDSSAMLSGSASLWVLRERERERELSSGNVESLAPWPGELAAVGFHLINLSFDGQPLND